MRYDIIISGGGLTGLILSLSLAQENYNILLIEKKNSSFCERVSRKWVFSSDSISYLKSLHIPVENIISSYVDKVIVREHKAKSKDHSSYCSYMDFDRSSSAKVFSFLGAMILENALIDELKKNIDTCDNVTLVYDKVTDSYCHKDFFLRIVKTEKKYYEAPLVISCEGVNSILRIKSNIHGYHHTHKDCLMCNIRCMSDNYTAQQVFYSDGPIGILPMGNRMYNIVWSCDKSDYFSNNLCLMEKELHKRLDNLIGDFTVDTSTVYNFPVKTFWSHESYKDRLLLCGNARYSFHPLGGQGANCIIQDIKNLRHFLAKEKYYGGDIGDAQFLGRYSQICGLHQLSKLVIFEFLYIFYKVDSLQTIRSFGSHIINSSSFIKKIIVDHITA